MIPFKKRSFSWHLLGMVLLLVTACTTETEDAPLSTAVPSEEVTVVPSQEPTTLSTEESFEVPSGNGEAEMQTPSVTHTITPPEEPTQTPTLLACEPIPPPGWVRYQIEQGDTLFALSLATGTTVAELMRVNCLPSDLITTGENLYLPFSPPPTLIPSHTATATFIAIDTPTSTSTPLFLTPMSTPTFAAIDTPTSTSTPLSPPPTSTPTSSPTFAAIDTPTPTSTPLSPPPTHTHTPTPDA